MTAACSRVGESTCVSSRADLIPRAISSNFGLHFGSIFCAWIALSIPHPFTLKFCVEESASIQLAIDCAFLFLLAIVSLRTHAFRDVA